MIKRGLNGVASAFLFRFIYFSIGRVKYLKNLKSFVIFRCYVYITFGIYKMFISIESLNSYSIFKSCYEGNRDAMRFVRDYLSGK